MVVSNERLFKDYKIIAPRRLPRTHYQREAATMVVTRVLYYRIVCESCGVESYPSRDYEGTKQAKANHLKATGHRDVLIVLRWVQAETEVESCG